MPDDSVKPLKCRTSALAHVFSIPLDDFNVASGPAVVETPLDVTPLCGQWSFKAEHTSSGDVNFTLGHSDVPVGALGQHVKITLSFFWLDKLGEKHDIRTFSWDPETLSPDGVWITINLDVAMSMVKRVADASRGAFVPATHRRYLFEAVFEAQDMPDTSQLDRPAPPDICILFPRSSDDPLRLYTSRDLLLRSSPYFETLLSSSFSEARVERSPKRVKITSDNHSLADFDDSDDEVDDLAAASLANSPAPTADPSHGFQSITVTESSYTSYKAVLTYLVTGYIDFAPLRSSRSPVCPDSESGDTRLDTVKASKESQTGVYPSSPKSIYRLAHFLELDALKSLALLHLRNGLVASTAAYELVSPVALLYDEVQAVVVAFVVEHLDEVEKTDAYREVTGRIRGGELPKAAPVMLALLEAQRKKSAKQAETA
ncbi:hypothetical protein JCM10207_005653 [Rhodosporidiobolus poonsookiae]